MATIINNPGSNNQNSTLSIVVILLLVIGVIVLAVLYVIPALQNSTDEEGAEINVTLPANTPNNGN
jgi:Na+-transporting NADH:ubiquinone oxidoreductase subunit NqrC